MRSKAFLATLLLVCCGPASALPAPELAHVALPPATDLPAGNCPYRLERAVRQRSGVKAEPYALQVLLTFDPGWDAEFDATERSAAVRELYDARDFRSLDVAANLLRKKKLQDADGRLAIDDLDEMVMNEAEGKYVLDGLMMHYAHKMTREKRSLADVVAVFQGWARGTAHSTLARLSLAHMLTEWAWEARGSGVAGTVTEEGWRLFAARLAQAKAVLAQPPMLEPDPSVEALRIVIGMGQSSDRATVRGALDRAWKLDAAHSWWASEAYSYYLLPRWSGAPGEFIHFVEEAARRTHAQLGDGLYSLLLAQEYSEAFDRDSGGEDWARCYRGFEDLLRRYPRGTGNYFRYCQIAYERKDYSTLVRLCKRVVNGETRLKFGPKVLNSMRVFVNWSEQRSQGERRNPHAP